MNIIQHASLYLTKYKEMHERAENSYDKMKISDEFFTEIAPGLINQINGEELSNGKAGAGITEASEPLHLPGHKSLSMRLIPD